MACSLSGGPQPTHLGRRLVIILSQLVITLSHYSKQRTQIWRGTKQGASRVQAMSDSHKETGPAQSWIVECSGSQTIQNSMSSREQNIGPRLRQEEPLRGQETLYFRTGAGTIVCVGTIEKQLTRNN